MNDPTELFASPSEGRRGFSLPPQGNLPDARTDFSQLMEKQRRVEATSVGDVVGSVFRQDGLVDGFAAELAGSGMEVQPDYNPVKHPSWKELTAGIQDEFLPALQKAHSPAHALFVRERLLQKQADLQRLGDLGVGGNLARLALNLVMPDQLLMGIASGGIARGYQAARIARAGGGLTGVAAAAKSASTLPAIGAGVAFGAAENTAYEALRQSVNFEDSGTELLTAGLFGGLFVAPFAVAGARQAGRIHKAAESELNALQALRDAEAGRPLSAEQVAVVREAHVKAAQVARIESGELTEAQTLQELRRMDNEAAVPDAAPTLDELAGAPAPARVDEPAVSTEPATPELPLEAPPPRPVESYIGQTVTFDHPKTGEPVEGEVVKVSGVPGYVLVKDSDTGKLVSVEASRLENALAAPFLAGSIGAAQVLPLGFVPRNSSKGTGYDREAAGLKFKAPVRFDLYSFLNESPTDGVRSLGHRLVKDAVGQKDGSAQDMTATEWKTHLRRQVAGAFHRESREAYQGAVKAAGVPIWQRGQFRRDFYEAAGPLLRGDDTVLQRFDPAVHPHLQKATAALRKGLDRFLEEAQNAGVKGAEGVAPNEAYVNRIWRQDRIRAAMELHGEDTVYQLLANAMLGMDRHGPLAGDTTKAKRFLQTVMRLEWSPAMQNVHLAGRDMGTLRGELKAAGLADEDINTIVDTMFEVKEAAGGDAGQAANLKFRFDLDETIVMKAPAGELRLSDLLENDARILMDRYADSMGGHVALAKVGITSQADWARQLKMLDDEVQASPVQKGGRYAKERQWLESIQKNILGRPMHNADFSSTARAAAAFRGYTRSVMLGQLGLTAAFEMKQAIGIMGMRAFTTQLPSFGAFLNALRAGHLPEEGLARDVMAIGGWGQEKAAAYARAREVDEHLPADLLNRAEHGANAVSHAVDIVSGNSTFTSITRQLSAMMSVQRLFDHATGHKQLDDAMTSRLAGQGLDGQYLQDVMAQLKQFADTDNGRVTGVRFEEWAAHDVDAYGKFQLYMSRQVRDAIQDQDLGETMPFMHSTLGKMFSELKTFFLVAHAKNLLKNAYHADATSLQVLLVGMLGEALAFSLQQAINFPDKLDERLAPEVMGPAVMARMSALGFAPMLLDTGYQLLTGESFLSPQSTSSGSNNRSFLNTPSLMTAGRLIQVPGLAAQGLLGTDTLTRKEFKDAWATVPGGNTYGLRGLGNWFSESLPKSEPKE